MQDLENLWKSVLGELEVTLSHASFSTWFQQTSIISNEDGHVVIAVPNIFNKRWLENKYHTDIKAAIDKADNSVKTIEYKVGGSKTAVAVAGKPGPSIKRAEIVKNTRQTVIPTAPTAANNLNPRYTFDRFVVGSSNDFAHAAARAVAKSPGTKYNPLFIYGGVGLGKTHLMQAVGNELLAPTPEKRIEYVSIESFTNEFIDAIQKKKNSAFTDKDRNVDVLI